MEELLALRWLDTVIDLLKNSLPVEQEVTFRVNSNSKHSKTDDRATPRMTGASHISVFSVSDQQASMTVEVLQFIYPCFGIEE